MAAALTAPALANPAEQASTAKLNSGYSIPLVGLGTWKSAKGEVRDAVLHALRVGYRHIDCAPLYGNEDEVGEALEQAFKEGIVTREQVFIGSKLWNTEHAPEKVEPALRKTLTDLKLDYLDLYLIHGPSSDPGPTITPPLPDVWAAMEALVDKGLARSIGVSNFSTVKLQSVLEGARIRPAVNQVEAHPYLRNARLLAWCKERGIHVTAYAPFGSPDSAIFFQRTGPTLLEDPTVLSVASALGKDAGQVLVRWALQRGTSAVPKSVRPERISSNLDVFSWSIPDELMAQLNAIKTQKRSLEAAFLLSEAGPYKTLNDLWDDDVDGEDTQPPAAASA